MGDCNEDLNQTDDEEIILRDEVSDEAIEAASFARGGLPTLAYGTYCIFGERLGCRTPAEKDKRSMRRGGSR
jgi:hypothetical protein